MIPEAGFSVRFPQFLWNLVLSFLSEARRDGKEKRIVSDDWVFVHSCTYSFYVMNRGARAMGWTLR